MIETQHIASDDLPLFAMLLLDPAETQTAALHLVNCAECRHSVAQARADLTVLALTVDLASPRASARRRFHDQLVAEEHATERSTQPAPIKLDEPANSGRRLPAMAPHAIQSQTDPNSSSLQSPVTEIRPARKTSALLPWLGWAVAAGISVFAVNQYRQRAELTGMVTRQSAQLQVVTTHLATFSAEALRARELMDTLTSPGAVRVTLNTTPAAKSLPQGRLSYVPEKGALVFIAANLQPAAPGKVYELWIIPADGTAPVPVSTFSPDARGSASVIMPSIPKQIAAKAFGVTLEAEGGASSPTLPILLAGAA